MVIDLQSDPANSHSFNSSHLLSSSVSPGHSPLTRPNSSQPGLTDELTGVASEIAVLWICDALPYLGMLYNRTANFEPSEFAVARRICGRSFALEYSHV